MKRIRIAPRTAYIQHPDDPEVRVKFKVPTRPQALQIQAEMAQYEKSRVLIDPFAPGKILTDNNGRPLTERYLEMPPTKLSEILGRFIEGVEGMTIEKDGQEIDAWQNGWTPEDLMDPSLDFETIEPVLDAKGNPVYELDDDGKPKLDEKGLKVVRTEPRRKTYWQLVLEHYVNPDLVEERASGKGSLTPSSV